MEVKDLRKKFEEFVSREITLTTNRYKEMKKKWNETTYKRDGGEITEEEASKIHQNLLKELEQAEIKFDNEEDFRKFSNLLTKMGIPLPFILKQVEHEIEHSKPYKQAGINSYFGWHSFSEPTGTEGLKAKKFQPFHKPFGEKYNSLSSFEKDVLHYKTLKAVSSLSESDREALKELEKRHGDKIKNSTPDN